MKILFPIILLFLTLFFSCKKKVQPELLGVQNACDCIEETSAAFKIEETSGDINIPSSFWSTETDTSYTDKNVYFTALADSAEYIWYIGVEVLHTKQVGRYFSDTWDNQTIPITLVVKKKPNKICFPNDDGYDSITKYVHFVKRPLLTGAGQPYPLNMAGTYRVKMPHVADSQDITIACICDEMNLNLMLSVTNYDGAGNNIDFASPFPSQGFRLEWRNYAEIQLGNGPAFSIGNYFFGFLRRKVNTNQFEFDISQGASTSSNPNYIKRSYFGRKIN